MFHHFHDGRHPQGQGSISQEDFDAILQFVGPRRIRHPVEWLNRLDAGRLEPGDVCLTFDDALRCQIDVALPVLEHYQLGAFWFVYSGVFEGHLERFEIYRAFRSRYFSDIDEFHALFFARVADSEYAARARAAAGDDETARWREAFPFYSANDVRFRLIRDRALGQRAYEQMMDEMIRAHGLQVSELARDLWMDETQLRHLRVRGDVVGLHSYSHPMVLADLSYAEQAAEYEQNFRHLRRVCGQDPQAMAHPANSYNDDTLQILEVLGIRCGFRANMAPPRAGSGLNPTRFELARQDHANIRRMLGGTVRGGR